MPKVITAFKRRPEMSVDAFREHWAAVHARRVSRLDRVRLYVQNMPGESAYAGGREPAFDAVAEAWFDSDRPGDPVATVACMAGDPDAATFADPASIVSLSVDEVPIIDGPHAPVKLVMFVRRRRGVTAERFRAHWRDVHGPLAARNPYMRRYMQCHAREDAAAFDGVGMVWFDSMDDLRASGTTPEAAEANEDGARFADGGGPAATLVVSETIVVA